VSLEQLRMVQPLTPVMSVQNRYTLTDRASESVLEHCTQTNIAFIPRGLLASNSSLPDTVFALAARHGVTVGALALAWALARSPVILPAPTTTSIAHLEANMAAVALVLPAEDVTALTALRVID
jgi:pyridoxine 4-dehydrogenase